MNGAVVPTHRVPGGGLPAWAEADATMSPAATLDAGLEVQLVQRWGDWANIRCTNGWMAWVDGRRLLPLTAQPGRTAPAMATPAPRAEATSGTGSIGAVLGSSRTVTIGGHAVQITAALVGAAVVAVASLLDWLSEGLLSASSFDIPVEFLVDPESASGGPDLGLLLLAAAIGGAVLCVLGVRERERRWIGGAVVAIAVLFAIQLQRWLSSFPADVRPSLFGTLGIGVFLTVAGGGLMLVPTSEGGR